MKNHFKTVNEVAKLTGLTARALHYYDQIDLLKPTANSEVGYRLYSDKDMETLQQIIFLKEIGFELKQIKDIVYKADLDKRETLLKHKELLMLKKKRIENLINLVDTQLEGEAEISFIDCDQSIIVAKQKTYHKEVIERWENTQAYQEFKQKQQKSTHEKYDMDQQVKIIFGEISSYMAYPPSHIEVQKLILGWQEYITKHYYTCSKEMLQCLGLMYVEDERFKNYINTINDGLAQYIYDAICYYCKMQ